MKETSFGQNFIHKNFPTITSQPTIALAELMANAWDAEATEVRIYTDGDFITIQDNGKGMTDEQFNNMWNVLRYSRSTEPVFVNNKRRSVFGKNGIGRYSVFCFADSYNITFRKEGLECKYNIQEVTETSNSLIRADKLSEAATSITGLSYEFTNNGRFTEDLVSDVAKRFIADPEFRLFLNNKEISLLTLDDKQIIYSDKQGITIYNIFSEDSVRLMFKGIAFWVANRLIGQPDWHDLQDGRTAIAKKNSYIVVTEGLETEIEDDWSNFRDTDKVNAVKKVALDKISEHLSLQLKDKKQTLKQTHIDSFKADIVELSIPSQNKIAAFVEKVYDNMLSLPETQTVDASIKALIIQEKSANGELLLSTISKMSAENIDTLANILSQWSVEDISKILFEIDYRLKIIEAIERVMGNKDVSELHVLHPLILESRWLFGPQYDTLEYTSNRQMTTVLKTFFNIAAKDRFIDRPDIIVKDDSSLINYQLDDMHDDFAKPANLLLIELKRGGFKIGFDEMTQAERYVTKILTEVQPEPSIRSFVVGYTISADAKPKVIDDRHKIEPMMYSVLVATAKKRLLNLQKNLKRYSNMPTHELLTSIRQDGVQISIEKFVNSENSK